MFLTAQSFGGPRIHDSATEEKTVTLSVNIMYVHYTTHAQQCILKLCALSAQEDHTLPPRTIDGRRAFTITAVSSVETKALHPTFPPPPTTGGSS